jgi:hypothetical protein
VNNTDQDGDRFPSGGYSAVKALRKIELTTGIATVALAIFSTCFYLLSSRPSEPLSSFLVYVALAILVAVGAYIDVFRNRSIGLPIIVVSSLIFAVLGLLAGGLYYTRSSWWGVPSLLPSITATITLIVSLLARRSGVDA